MRGKLILFILAILLFSSIAAAEDNNVEVYVFYGQGCPHCSVLNLFLEDLQEKYSSLEVQHFEVYHNQEDRELFEQMTKAFNTNIMGVPTTFIDKQVIVGFSDKIGEQIEDAVKDCVDKGCISPIELSGEESISVVGESSPAELEKDGILKGLTFSAVTVAAAVDAINPCAFAVLIILLTTILAAKLRKRVILAGLAFTLSIYISYFLMGIGLYSAVQAAGVAHWFYAVVGVLAILLGLFNLKDYLWYGKWFVMEVPMSWRPKLKMLIKGVTSVPGAFLIGFAVSLFLLPCTSGPYIVILGLLAKATTRNIALLYLIYYNFIFILPMLIITLAIGFGFTTTEEAEEWRQKKLKVLHLIAGVIILLLGIGMLAALALGMV
ncbi:cytochrome c biogenesis protein [Candidatus Woesearchaeota archaeon]|nr:cytochrome c biogenesis protein [Candidatus Woesearchaeota archaeon]